MLNKLSLGTANFNKNYGLNKEDQKFSQKNIKKILNFSISNNIRNIDTATKYLGVEQKLGKFNLNKFKVSTKLESIPYNCKNIEKYILEKISNSLKQLNIKKIENYFVHDSNDLITSKFKDKIFQALILAKKIGLIKKIGISIYSIKDLKKIIEKYKIDVVQLPYSLFDRRFEKVIYKLKKKKILVQARSIFLQGLLLSDPSSLPRYFLKFKELKEFNCWAKKNKVSKLEASINFVKNYSQIDNFIIGFNNFKQLKHLCKFFKKKKKKLFPKNIYSKNVKLIDPRKWH